MKMKRNIGKCSSCSNEKTNIQTCLLVSLSCPKLQHADWCGVVSQNTDASPATTPHPAAAPSPSGK